MTQKQIIIHYLNQRNEWVRSYELIKTETMWGWLGSQADRRARELAEDKQIDHRINGKYSEYKVKLGIPRFNGPIYKPVKKEAPRLL